MSDNIVDKQLYESIKQKIQSKIKGRNWGAYDSGRLISQYKQQGGQFRTPEPTVYTNDLKRWYAEKWGRVPGNTPNQYPVYRPTVRVNSKTPATVSEIPRTTIDRQIRLKQVYIGRKNLPKFV